jgi:hypothetical protein
VYLVDAARPATRPAAATRDGGIPPLTARTVKYNALTIMNVVGTSVTPKCESRTCR